jgi:GNAT superfamily N-acetyltransferase
MPDDLARAFAFMRLADMLGTRVEQSPYGTAVRTPELPLRQDSNYLLVDRTDARAVDLARELDRLSLRALVVRGEEAAARLANEFSALGWQAHRHLVMAHRRPPERTADTGLVTEVGEQTLRELRRRITLSYPWGSPELAEQLLEAKSMMTERVETHFLAVVVDHEPVAYADLYLGEGVAQIEDVLTLEKHRNRGYASALVLRGIEEAKRRGVTLSFLVADADDWPRHLYARLGFDVIGRYAKFFI